MKKSHALTTNTDPRSTELGLRVSRAALRFNPADPGEESFLILKITPPWPQASITLSLDNADSFQVAVGGEKMRFCPALEFNPDADGSYVHLRYAPRRVGRHQGHLFVECGQQTLTVSLWGRTRGLAGAAIPPRTLPAPEMTDAISSKWGSKLGVGLLLTGLTIGLAVTGYTYRCQLWSAWCLQSQPESVTKSAPVAPESIKKSAKLSPTSTNRKLRPKNASRRSRFISKELGGAKGSKSVEHQPITNPQVNQSSNQPIQPVTNPSAPDATEPEQVTL